jgi:hypothetical protein
MITATDSVVDALRVGGDQTHSTAPHLFGHVTELHQHDLVRRDGTRYLQVETGLELRKGKHWTVRNVQLAVTMRTEHLGHF